MFFISLKWDYLRKSSKNLGILNFIISVEIKNLLYYAIIEDDFH